MKEFWNERYGGETYVYGEEPNEYFKEQITKLHPGSILLPAEGEGRNAVYAAKLGWDVSAFDISYEGKNKAEKLAKRNHVTIDYKTGDLTTIHYSSRQFDAIGLIYTHFPSGIRSFYHQMFSNYLKKNGTIILEAFSKKHINYNKENGKVGGPKDAEMLYSLDDIRTFFGDFEIQELTETEVKLNEGIYHVGLGSVIRFVGKKTN